LTNAANSRVQMHLTTAVYWQKHGTYVVQLAYSDGVKVYAERVKSWTQCNVM
jgi:hypothetical protein